MNSKQALKINQQKKALKNYDKKSNQQKKTKQYKKQSEKRFKNNEKTIRKHHKKQ